MTYFGELLGSNLEKWDDNQYDQFGEKTPTPTNYYNQFNLQYRILPATSVFISPRFLMQIGDRNELSEKEDRNNVTIDDWQIGVLQEYFRNKSLTFRGRLSHRHPLSKASQNSLIDSQIEYQSDLMWLATPRVTVLFWNTLRYYAYEAEKNENRYRINTTTIANYSFNDQWGIQIFHEWDMQHRAPKEGNRNLNKQKWNYFEKNKNHVALGVGYSPTKGWSIIPFVKALNDEDWSAKTTQIGMWVLGRIF